MTPIQGPSCPLCWLIARQLLIDRLGRKPMLYTGSIVMLVCMVTVGVIVAKFRHDWPSHRAGGWAACGEFSCHFLLNTIVY